MILSPDPSSSTVIFPVEVQHMQVGVCSVCAEPKLCCSAKPSIVRLKHGVLEAAQWQQW